MISGCSFELHDDSELWMGKDVEGGGRDLVWVNTEEYHERLLPYFSIDNAHLMYNAHPNAHDAN